MIDVFEKAKFRDTFVTRDGRLAVLQRKDDSGWYHLFTEQKEILVCGDGQVHSFGDTISDDDIIGFYVEPIDEKKLSENVAKWTNFVTQKDFTLKTIAETCAAIGYRKAKEER